MQVLPFHSNWMFPPAIAPCMSSVLYCCVTFRISFAAYINPSSTYGLKKSGNNALDALS